jgi:hypothetical protein
MERRSHGETRSASISQILAPLVLLAAYWACIACSEDRAQDGYGESLVTVIDEFTVAQDEAVLRALQEHPLDATGRYVTYITHMLPALEQLVFQLSKLAPPNEWTEEHSALLRAAHRFLQSARPANDAGRSEPFTGEIASTEQEFWEACLDLRSVAQITDLDCRFVSVGPIEVAPGVFVTTELPPPLPAGYALATDYYQVQTSGTPVGPVTMGLPVYAISDTGRTAALFSYDGQRWTEIAKAEIKAEKDVAEVTVDELPANFAVLVKTD